MILLNLTEEQLNIVVQGLGELPLKQSMYTFSVIQQQVKEQKEDKSTTS